MTSKPSRFTSGAALAAALSMIATPAAAVELPDMSGSGFASADVEVNTGEAADQNQHRHYRRHRHRNRVDAGDVIAGVLVLGTIAAIAGSSRSRDRDRDYRDRDYPDRDYRDRDYRDDRGGYDRRGMERAVDMCIDQIERGRDEVDDISSARRTSDGWRITGTLENNESWSCWIDNDGRVRNVDVGAPSYSYDDAGDFTAAAPAGEQWDEGAYARARATTRTASDSEYTYREEPRVTATSDGPRPSYPGGPLPGEEAYGDEGYGDNGYDNSPTVDGRYSTAEAPDFEQPGS
ncbi:hypothetical protein [Erythrobacter alti]|uniref:hypothetical protein n=1 Tax=Erythrobacter alti TaxID=1896145 RepID=UPI0030F4239E